MKIAVINETSAADKNKDILVALEESDHTIINAGMNSESPRLTGRVPDSSLLSQLIFPSPSRTRTISALFRLSILMLSQQDSCNLLT